MHPEALQKHLGREPFVSFRVHFSDPRAVEIVNPGLAYVTGTSLYVFSPVRWGRDGNYVANPEPRMISLRHIVSLEPIEHAAA